MYTGNKDPTKSVSVVAFFKSELKSPDEDPQSRLTKVGLTISLANSCPKRRQKCWTALAHESTASVHWMSKVDDTSAKAGTLMLKEKID
jgi:hypothetical protein